MKKLLFSIAGAATCLLSALVFSEINEFDAFDEFLLPEFGAILFFSIFYLITLFRIIKLKGYRVYKFVYALAVIIVPVLFYMYISLSFWFKILITGALLIVALWPFKESNLKINQKNIYVSVAFFIGLFFLLFALVPLTSRIFLIEKVNPENIINKINISPEEAKSLAEAINWKQIKSGYHINLSYVSRMDDGSIKITSNFLCETYKATKVGKKWEIEHLSTNCTY